MVGWIALPIVPNLPKQHPNTLPKPKSKQGRGTPLRDGMRLIILNFPTNAAAGTDLDPQLWL